MQYIDMFSYIVIKDLNGHAHLVSVSFRKNPQIFFIIIM